MCNCRKYETLKTSKAQHTIQASAMAKTNHISVECIQLTYISIPLYNNQIVHGSVEIHRKIYRHCHIDLSIYYLVLVVCFSKHCCCLCHCWQNGASVRDGYYCWCCHCHWWLNECGGYMCKKLNALASRSPRVY